MKVIANLSLFGLLCNIHSVVAQSPRPLNIILTNDDGFETALIQSLFNALVTAGHKVVMSAPYLQQSGTSATIDFLRPITSTTRASPKGTIPSGAPGVGPTTIKPRQYYVNGAVTGSVLYGVDVLAPVEFNNSKIDLVLSGPNEGQNVGLFSPHSGTVGAVVTTLNRGIPSIACSADASEPQTDLVGSLMVKFLGSLPRTPTGGLNLNGVGLNLNFPRLTPSTTVNDYSFIATTTGIATNSVGLKFVARLSDCPVAVGSGVNVPLPGLCLDAPYTAAGYPLDTNPLSEGTVIQDGQQSIAVSVIEGTYQADATISQTVFSTIPFTSLNGPNLCRSIFNLWDAKNDTKFTAFGTGATISNPPCSMNIEIAPTNCTVAGPAIITVRKGSEVISTRNENVAPYMAFGDNGKGDVLGLALAVPGSYSFEYLLNGKKKGPITFNLAGTCKP